MTSGITAAGFVQLVTPDSPAPTTAHPAGLVLASLVLLHSSVQSNPIVVDVVVSDNETQSSLQDACQKQGVSSTEDAFTHFC